MFRKQNVAAFLAALMAGAVLSAQITVPYSFTSNTRIVSAEMNSNFDTIEAQALNRTGGTMTGTLTTQGVVPDGNNTRDLGSTGTRFKDGWFAGTLTATTFAGSGASITSVPETAITDGALLARVADDETVSGTWTFTNLPKVTAAAAGFSLNQTGGTSGSRNWQFYANADQLQLITGSDVEGFGSNVLVITRSGTTPTQATFTPRIQATNQPGFLAYNSANDVLGGGSPATVDFDTEVYDTGSNFTADTFTAPVTGIYELCAQVRFFTGSSTSFAIVTSNRGYAMGLSTGAASGGGCVHADMDASDTATVQAGFSAGEIYGGVLGYGNAYITYFSGRLVP
jgi:hypothetical protein